MQVYEQLEDFFVVENCNIYPAVELLYLSVSVPLKKNASATVSHFTSY